MRSLLPVLTALAACQALDDTTRTGVRIGPKAGTHEGPVDLVVVNRTGSPLRCEAWQDEGCPTERALPLDGLEQLEPGDRWEVQEVECAVVDVACMPADGGLDALPVRTWAWQIVPPLEEEDG